MTTFEASSIVRLRAPGESPKALAAVRHFLSRVPLSVLIAGGYIALLVIVAIFARWIAPDSPYSGSLANRLLGLATSGHLLGTDGEGRDMLSRLMWGAGPTLFEGVAPVTLAGLIGGTLGVVAGMSASRMHAFIMRSLDVLYSFSAVLLAIAPSPARSPRTFGEEAIYRAGFCFEAA